ncbi:MAG: neutral/alkaline non-lysosomal ceramidase N-terminal domain-containing protein [Clostridia bacterium]|nr:neutral/alkaline non-lysosomal ceramidase N-terminal domain-containing protein [Clostridia bacterium]
MKEFLVGMAKGDITPEVGSLLYGYPSKRPSERVLDGLKVSAIAISQNNETVLLISSDLCSIGIEECDFVRESISKDFNIPFENIIFSAIHTHSGPVTRTSAGWGTADMDYLKNILIPVSCDIAKKAIESLKPAVMAVGITDSYVGVNRREMENGEVILGQNPDGPYDPQMTLVMFKTQDGENIGSFIHFATHPTSAGANLSITRDWPGFMMDRIEEITKAPCMYVNGAEGDIGPRLSNGKTIADEPSMVEMGKIAAKDAEKAYENLGEFKAPELKTLSADLFLPYIEAPTYESVLADMKAMGNPEDLIEVDISTYARLEKIKGMYERGEAFAKGLTLKHIVISMGDLAIVPLPFELFCEISLGIKKGSPFSKTLVFGLSNGSRGYIPTEDQIPFGGYEIGSFRAASIPGFIDGLDKHLVKENVNFLNRLNNK